MKQGHVLKEDGPISQSVSVSESPEGQAVSKKVREKKPISIKSGSKTSGRNRAVSRDQAKSDDRISPEAQLERQQSHKGE